MIVRRFTDAGLDEITHAIQQAAKDEGGVSRRHAGRSNAGSAGNALAAMLRPCEIEVRFHQAFDDREVARIIARLLAQPQLASLASAQVTYQGRPLKV